MADRGDTHYHIPTLNNWFLISSLLLLISVVWMVVEDWNAPWKAYQREFRAIELERANAELEQPEFVAAAEREVALREELDAAQAELDGRAEEVAAVKEELRVLKGQQFVDTEDAKGAKMFYNWERYELDHKVAKHGGEPAYAQEIADDVASLAEFELAMNVAAGVKETTDLTVKAKEEELAQLTKAVDQLEKSM